MLIIKLLASLLAICITSCSSSTDFSGRAGASQNSKKSKIQKSASEDLEAEDESDDDDNEFKAEYASFKIAQATKETATDIIWLVDNSGSMRDEAARVRANLERFVSSVSAVSQAKAWLVSASTDAPVTIVAPPSPLISQIDTYIGSTNGLAVLASLLCPAATSSAMSSPKLCNRPLAQPTSFNQFWQEMMGSTNRLQPPFMINRYTSKFGLLNSQLRAGAKKIVIAVTDDDAQVVGANEFRVMVQSVIPSDKFRLFAIAARQESVGRCNVTRQSLAFEDLAKKSGGSTYNICESDWSKLFDSLIKDIKKYVIQNEFVLPSEVSKIMAVKLDAIELSPSQYDFTNGMIKVESSLLSESSKELVVKYQ